MAERTVAKRRVGVGDVVKVETSDVEPFRVQIYEDDPVTGGSADQISIKTPLARAILGRKEGDKAKVDSPEPYTVKIARIRPPAE